MDGWLLNKLTIMCKHAFEIKSQKHCNILLNVSVYVLHIKY